ncbi:hypothetical protein B0H17DRAFT_1133020 [Mycena rosella]|uniref:Uncharacterized protein n=1 Tax=Mycena rosella TaxID=1033263 RepID=A0AAD7DLR1_MYCRO|nr:hypothetical protein B0H17DRAFT_1133020 [Mycena rosella]
MKTTTQVIDEGEYLQDGFQPERLTIPDLRGVLTFHDPSTDVAGRKPVLLALFKTHITDRRSKLLEKREAEKRVKPSSDNVIDVTVTISTPARRARRSHCFTIIRVRMMSGFKLARRREMVSRPPEKLCSTATAEPEKAIRVNRMNEE